MRTTANNFAQTHQVHHCIFGPLLLLGLLPFPLAVISLMSGGLIFLISMPNIWLAPLLVTSGTFFFINLTRHEPMFFEIVNIGFRHSRTIWYRGGSYVV